MLQSDVLHSFSNIGLQSSGRSFPGFAQKSFRDHLIAPRETVRIEMRAGDLLSLSGITIASQVSLLVIDANGEFVPAHLGLKATSQIDLSDFDSEELVSRASANGRELPGSIDVAAIDASDEPIVLKALQQVSVWVICPVNRSHLIGAEGNGIVEVQHRAADKNRLVLPAPLGSVRDEFTIDRATARAYTVRKGEYLQIIDVEGQQCSDFMAFRVSGLERGEELMIDSTATRSIVRHAYPGPGLFDKFFDRNMRPLMRVVQDTCGRHDTFGLACTARGYEDRGFPGHVNCSDNISNALGSYGVAERSAWPAINFFWNTWVDQHTNQLMTEESHSRPGDFVTLQAMDDLVCVSTACPDDIDPINGWNPTDVHVRIYRPDTPVQRAVAYRQKEDAAMQVSQESAFHKRLAPLTPHFAPARDLWLPVSYPSVGTIGEYWACRDAVTLQDLSALRKFDVIGPDAERLLQLAMTRDVAKLSPWRGFYSLICDESGELIDDGTLFRLAPDLFRWCCGSEESGRALETLARENGLQARVHALGNALPNLALQGPRSRDLLKKIVFTQPHVPALEQMKWFGASVARLGDREGVPFMLTRSGYTGELGYELFCSKSDAVALWDAVMEAGEGFGIQPMGSAALDIIRIEAGLASAGAEFAAGVDAYEAGLGFAVDLKKADFQGKAALERNAKDPRRVLKGLLIDCDDVPPHGAPVLLGERQVGVITSATRSPSLERAIAMARLAVEHAENGNRLHIGLLNGRTKQLGAEVCDIPFIDPQRTRARA